VKRCARFEDEEIHLQEGRDTSELQRLHGYEITDAQNYGAFL